MTDRVVRIGVLALQGDFAKHIEMFAALPGVEPFPVRTVDEFRGADGLVIPGGESTTIGKLMERFGLLSAVREAGGAGLPIFGTCAGMILLAKEIRGSTQQRLGLLSIEVARNAYGRQIESFEADLAAPALGAKPIRAVFIRAPQVVSTGPGVEVLASFEDLPVLVRQGTLLAVNFHSELTDDTRLHEYFVSIVRDGTLSAGLVS